jgi:GrpB-like predicted nucleotidyltransferase (UPF0157 family)
MAPQPIDIMAYQARWVEEGFDHAEAVAKALGGLALRVDHVGSTAVAGLAAKDVIDIQAQVLDLDDGQVIEAMTGAGFRHKPANTRDIENPDTAAILGEDDWRKLYFREADGQRRVHIHVRRNSAAASRNTLLLRDYLRDDTAARRDYGDFKLALAERTRQSRAAYAAIKRPYILTAQRAAEAWAHQTRWVPGSPDVYWSSAE